MKHTWLKEFYPIDAGAAAKLGTEEIIEHSLVKWSGLKKENMVRHGVRFGYDEEEGEDTDSIYDIDTEEKILHFGTVTCSLCQRFNTYKYAACLECPLRYEDGSKCYSPGRGYHVFQDTGRPDLMIQELKQALNDWRQENGQR